MKQIIPLIAAAVLLAACSPDGSTPKIASDQRAVMDQANNVENVIQQGAEHQQQAAEPPAQQGE